MIFGGIVDLVIAALLFTLGIKFNEKYPTAAHYCAFLWNGVEIVAKGLFGLFNKPTPPAAK